MLCTFFSELFFILLDMHCAVLFLQVAGLIILNFRLVNVLNILEICSLRCLICGYMVIVKGLVNLLPSLVRSYP